jgi:hypothetical protein
MNPRFRRQQGESESQAEGRSEKLIGDKPRAAKNTPTMGRVVAMPSEAPKARIIHSRCLTILGCRISRIP